MPILVAPWAYQKMAHPDGELATARAAAHAGTIMVVSTTTQAYLEDVASAAEGPKWWQLYIFTDRGFTAERLKSVAASGYAAICFTVDFPVAGLRHRDTRSGFEMPVGLPDDDLVFDPNIRWDDLAWIREQAPLPLLVKGIMTAEDARVALDHGVDGIVVSNHGARQLDAVAAPLAVLPEIVDAVQGRVPVLVDGGFRRGTDVFKALALGASAVLVGRPTAWGLAAAGEDGVFDVLRILREELENVMTLAGDADGRGHHERLRRARLTAIGPSASMTRDARDRPAHPFVLLRRDVHPARARAAGVGARSRRRRPDRSRHDRRPRRGAGDGGRGRGRGRSRGRALGRVRADQRPRPVLLDGHRRRARCSASCSGCTTSGSVAGS